MRRRTFVIRAAALACLPPLSTTLGCTDPEGETTSDGEAGTSGASGSTTADASTSNESASVTTSPSSSSTTAGSSSGEASSSTGADDDSTTVQLDSGTSPPPEMCTLTPEDIEGPFYRTRIPAGGDLDVHDDAGVPLLLDGRVLDEDCLPIEGAIVEIWHATPLAPGGMPGDAQAQYDNTAAYRYYGQVTTDAAGDYAFSTLRPGWYLNGDDYRPAHVHLKVWVDGAERLTTQIYFEDDPFNDADPWFNEDMAIAPDGDGAATLDIIV